MDYTVHEILQARILEWVAFPFSKGSSQPRIEPRSHALQMDSLPAEPQGKPKNTGVGSLSLLQGIFPIQEVNWGILHCRQILYQLSYQGNNLCPSIGKWINKTLYIYMLIYIYICIHTYIHTDIYIHICIHTHIYKHTDI